MDNVVVNGRRILFEVAKSALAEKDIKLTVPAFSRYCLGRSIKSFANLLLASTDKARLSPEKLAERINKGYRDAMAAAGVRISRGITAVFKRAAELRVPVGVLSGLDRSVTDGVLSRHSLAASHMLAVSSTDRVFPSVDAWLRAAKNMGVKPAACVAVASSAAACKEALAAGMRCVAVADEFTSFQDFGGVDFVVDSIDDEAVDRMVSLLDLEP
jgi:beta-phosphoglucomutase-like phosphatase (HAD superfamily)